MRLLTIVFTFILLANLAFGIPYDWDFEWVGEPGYEWDGVEPDYFESDRHFVYKIRVSGDLEPQWVTLNLDWNGDGNFSRDEQVPMKMEKRDDRGFVYSAEVIFNRSFFKNPMEYYFSAQIGYMVKTSPLMFGPFFGNKVSFAFIGDTLWDIAGPVFPLEIVVNSSRNTFYFVNTGDVPITFGLSIDENMDTPWKPAERYVELGENKYILSAIFTKSDVKQVKKEWFNSMDYEDVISEVPRFAEGEVFGFNGVSAGKSLSPNDTVALWFSLLVPPSSDGSESDNVYSLRVKIFAVSE